MAVRSAAGTRARCGAAACGAGRSSVPSSATIAPFGRERVGRGGARSEQEFVLDRAVPEELLGSALEGAASVAIAVTGPTPAASTQDGVRRGELLRGPASTTSGRIGSRPTEIARTSIRAPASADRADARPCGGDRETPPRRSHSLRRRARRPSIRAAAGAREGPEERRVVEVVSPDVAGQRRPAPRPQRCSIARTVTSAPGRAASLQVEAVRDRHQRQEDEEVALLEPVRSVRGVDAASIITRDGEGHRERREGAVGRPRAVASPTTGTGASATPPARARKSRSSAAQRRKAAVEVQMHDRGVVAEQRIRPQCDTRRSAPVRSASGSR